MCLKKRFYIINMHFSEMDLTDYKNPFLTILNGVVLDKRTLCDKVKGTYGWYYKNFPSDCYYCDICHDAFKSKQAYEEHFERRAHQKAIHNPKKPFVYF